MDRIKFTAVMLTALMLALSSCVRDVIMDAEERPTVVVECILTNSAMQELHLNFTKGASKTVAEPLTEAAATLIDLTSGMTVGEFDKASGDLWTLDYSPVSNHRYRLEIQVPGYDLIYAEDTMPESLYVYSITWTENVIDNAWGPPVPSFRNNTFCAGTVFSFESLPKYTLIYGMNYNTKTDRHEIADEIFTNLPVVDNFNITSEVYFPEIVKWEENLYVSCDAVRSLYADLKGVPKHKQYLLLNKEELSDHLFQFMDQEAYGGYDFMVFGSFTGDWYWRHSSMQQDFGKPLPTEGYLMFESLSDNYLAYIRDAIHFMQLKESTDMTTIYLRDNIYTNVVGGRGIFAATFKQVQQCANTFRTGILEESFSAYGIIADEEGYNFSDNEPYEYPLWGADGDRYK
ncbi:MAG: DUF4249 family protein [Bacteroidales bacterium]|nr:DUF4249 family protein [Bacteroidales bacterium]